MSRPPSQAERQRAVDDFNARHPLGTPLWAYTGLRGENPIPATLRAPAELLSGHTPVAWLNGVSGCIALTHLDPRTPEPAGDGAEAVAAPSLECADCNMAEPDGCMKATWCAHRDGPQRAVASSAPDAVCLVPFEMLKPFELIVQVDAKMPDGESTLVNISRIRDLVNAAAPAPATARGRGDEPEHELIERLLDAQQDINLAANETMRQSLADASALIDEIEPILRAALASQPQATGGAVEREAELSVGLRGMARAFMETMDEAQADLLIRAAVALEKTAPDPSQGFGASREQSTGAWALYAVGGDVAGIGLTAGSDATCDLALSALRTQRLIEALRADEGDCVTICSDNPEAIDADHRTAIDCNGDWTDWNDRRFHGATVLQCLTKALQAREEARG